MADSFIPIEITTDANQLADDTVTRLQGRWPGWTPNEGDQEVVLIEELAPMAQNAAEVAARVPPEVFRTVGTDLHGVAAEDGQPAQASLTFTLTDSLPHLLEAGTQVLIDGFTFETLADANNGDSSTGSVIASVAAQATVDGVAANDLPGDQVAMITAFAWVADVTLDAPTSSGVDPEDPATYLNRLSRKLELQGWTLVTTRDYQLMALDQEGVGRAVALSDPVNRLIVVVVTDANGEIVGAPIKTALAATIELYRQATWNVSLADPTYTPVNVTYEVVAYQGWDPTDLISRINATLDQFFSPATWGSPTRSEDTTLWLNLSVVRVNKLIDLVGSVAGVDYVDTLTITGSGVYGSAADDTGDMILPGTVPLARPGVFSGSVVAG